MWGEYMRTLTLNFEGITDERVDQIEQDILNYVKDMGFRYRYMGHKNNWIKYYWARYYLIVYVILMTMLFLFKA